MSDCYCDFEPAQFYRAARHKSRKARRCSECGRTIAPGEQYEHVHGKWDGEIGTFNTCQRCLALRDLVEAHIPCFCWAHGDVVDGAIETARGFEHESPELMEEVSALKDAIYRAPAFSEERT